MSANYLIISPIIFLFDTLISEKFVNGCKYLIDIVHYFQLQKFSGEAISYRPLTNTFVWPVNRCTFTPLFYIQYWCDTNFFYIQYWCDTTA